MRETGAQRRIGRQLTLPNYEGAPPKGLQLLELTSIPFPILRPLQRPKLCVGLRQSRASWAIVSVPKAPINEDHLSTSGKNEIGSSRKRSLVKPKPVPGAMEKAA
jgi:hypothetical protein